jgi:hypothetical protein
MSRPSPPRFHASHHHRGIDHDRLLLVADLEMGITLESSPGCWEGSLSASSRRMIASARGRHHKT